MRCGVVPSSKWDVCRDGSGGGVEGVLGDKMRWLEREDIRFTHAVRF